MIHIIITGGTFDKVYDVVSGELKFSKSHVDEGLQRARCNLPYSLEQLMLVDSLHLTDKDRRVILRSTLDAEAEKIIITHGTDTMAQTARYLADHLAASKVVMLTGSMYPYHLPQSDALFNLGTAVAFVQIQPPGVYVAMNGLCLPAYEAEKNHQHAMFQKVQQQPSSQKNALQSQPKDGLAP